MQYDSNININIFIIFVVVITIIIVVVTVHVGGRPCPIRRVGPSGQLRRVDDAKATARAAAAAVVVNARDLFAVGLTPSHHRDVDTSERFDHIVRTQSVFFPSVLFAREE